MKTRMLWVALATSVVANVAIVAGYFKLAIDGCAERPDGRLGVLTRDVEVGKFDGRDQLFVLPKGLVVRDASATGADWFEPNRFRLIVTSEHKGLVRYPDAIKKGDGEYYSADIHDHAAAPATEKARTSDH